MADKLMRQQFKFLLVPMLCLQSLFCCFAQNGIPLDVLRDHPYFTDGEQTDADTDANKDTDTNTDTDENLTASSNSNPTTNSNSTTNSNTDTDKSSDSPSKVKIPEPLYYEDVWKDKKIDVSVGYMAFYTYVMQSGGIADYLDLSKTFNIYPYGASVRSEFMVLPSIVGANGIGLEFSWNPIKVTNDNYTLFANMIVASLFLSHKVRFPGTRFLIELHAGGGGLFFLKPTFTYANKYQPQSYFWIYPQAMGGIAFQKYITKHWGIDVCVDVVWPFLVEVPFPLAQVSVS